VGRSEREDAAVADKVVKTCLKSCVWTRWLRERINYNIIAVGEAHALQPRAAPRERHEGDVRTSSESQ
jgi:hypothetical protein